MSLILCQPLSQVLHHSGTPGLLAGDGLSSLVQLSADTYSSQSVIVHVLAHQNVIFFNLISHAFFVVDFDFVSLQWIKIVNCMFLFLVVHSLSIICGTHTGCYSLPSLYPIVYAVTGTVDSTAGCMLKRFNRLHVSCAFSQVISAGITMLKVLPTVKLLVVSFQAWELNCAKMYCKMCTSFCFSLYLSTFMSLFYHVFSYI